MKSSKLADLIDKEELEEIKAIDESDEDDWESNDEPDEELESDYDNEELDTEAEANLETDTAALPWMTLTKHQEGCHMLMKASTLASFVQNSPTWCTQLHDACTEAGVPNLSLIQPIMIQWNTHANCLLHMLELHCPVHNLCRNPEYKRFLFSYTEWTIMEQL